jgi:hypothetical protein
MRICITSSGQEVRTDTEKGTGFQRQNVTTDNAMLRHSKHKIPGWICTARKYTECLNDVKIDNDWLLVAVITVQFVPHRKHTPSPYSKAIPVTGRGGL